MRQTVTHARENILSQHALRRKDSALYTVNELLRRLNPSLRVEDAALVSDEGMIARMQLEGRVVRNAGNFFCETEGHYAVAIAL